jgi:hypothetical protein
MSSTFTPDSSNPGPDYQKYQETNNSPHGSPNNASSMNHNNSSSSSGNGSGLQHQQQQAQPVYQPQAQQFSPKITSRPQMSFTSKFFFQVRLLLRKRFLELMNRKMDIFYLTIPPLLFFSLTILIYAVIGIFFPDGAEEYLIPIGFWIFTQKVVVTIMYEKSQKLTEAMRMMGLLDSAYWTSYFIRLVRIHLSIS